MNDYIYGKGGKTKGKRRITCDACGARRYIDSSRFDKAAKYVCGNCLDWRKDEIESPPYEAHMISTCVQVEDQWRPSWYSYRFIPAGTIDDFLVGSIGWENMRPEDRARHLVTLGRRSLDIENEDTDR